MGGVDGKTRQYGSFGEGVRQVYTQTRRASLGSLEIFDFGHMVDTVWWKSGVVFLLK